MDRFFEKGCLLQFHQLTALRRLRSSLQPNSISISITERWNQNKCLSKGLGTEPYLHFILWVVWDCIKTRTMFNVCDWRVQGQSWRRERRVSFDFRSDAEEPWRIFCFNPSIMITTVIAQEKQFAFARIERDHCQLAVYKFNRGSISSVRAFFYSFIKNETYSTFHGKLS